MDSRVPRCRLGKASRYAGVIPGGRLDRTAVAMRSRTYAAEDVIMDSLR